MTKTYKAYIYQLDTHFEAEVDGITLARFGTNVPELRDQPAVFVHDTKDGIIKEIISTLKGLGLSGNLRIVK